MGVQAGAVLPPRPRSTDALQRVLVADPDPLERSRVCAILRDQGILARTAETTEEILAATGVDTVLVSLDGAGRSGSPSSASCGASDPIARPSWR